MLTIDGLATIKVVVVFILVRIVVSQDTSQDTDIYVPKVGGMKATILCQGYDRLLTCTNTSMVIVINKAWYQRKEKGKVLCPYDKTKEKEDTDDQKVNCQKDVGQKLKEICNKRKACQLSAKKEVFGRPCPGVYKYLEVIYACGLPVYVPKNVTLNVTVNVTKPNVTNDTQSNTTILPTTSTTSNRTMLPLNSSYTTHYTSSQPVTSAVPFFPSSTIIKTINDVKQQPSTSTASFSHYSTSIMGQQSSAPFQLSTAGKLLIWFLHFRGKIVATPAQTDKQTNM